MNSHTKAALVAVTAATMGLLGAACGDDDTTPASGSSSGTTSSGGSSGGSSGMASSSGSSGEVPDLYTRLGGKSGLEMFTANVVDTKILADPVLVTYFFNQVANPIPAGKPSKQQIVVCFARFVGAALGKDTYPGAPVNDATNTNTPNFTCRTMTASHKTGTDLKINDGTFDAFVGLIAESLMPLVKPQATKAGEITQAEFDALAAALVGTKGDISTGAGAKQPFPTN